VKFVYAQRVRQQVKGEGARSFKKLLVRSDPIHRVIAGHPHECGHYEQERVETEYDGLLSEKWRSPVSLPGYARSFGTNWILIPRRVRTTNLRRSAKRRVPAGLEIQEERAHGIERNRLRSFNSLFCQHWVGDHAPPLAKSLPSAASEGPLYD